MTSWMLLSQRQSSESISAARKPGLATTIRIPALPDEQRTANGLETKEIRIEDSPAMEWQQKRSSRWEQERLDLQSAPHSKSVIYSPRKLRR